MLKLGYIAMTRHSGPISSIPTILSKSNAMVHTLKLPELQSSKNVRLTDRLIFTLK